MGMPKRGAVNRQVKKPAKKPNGRRRRRDRAKAFRIASAVLCVLIPPLGLILTWKSSWRTNVKYGLSVLAVGCFALMVVLVPAPSSKVEGGITLVGTEPEAEVYGPDEPESLVSGYTASSSDDTILAEATDEPDEEYVYAIPGGTYYHTSDCSSVTSASQKLTLYEAYYMGYKQCTKCNPPTYVQGTM